MPVITEFKRFLGTDFQIQVTIYEADQQTPQNITGWSLLFAFHYPWSTTDLVSITTGRGIVLTNPTLGIATVTVAASLTASLLPANYQFRIQRTDPGFSSVVTDGILTLCQP